MNKAGFLTCPPWHLPTRKRAVAIERQGINELTATGIVPDSNRIPFYEPLPQSNGYTIIPTRR